MFNIVSSKAPSTPLLTATAQQIVNSFNKNKLPFGWWVGPNALDCNAQEILISVGMRFKEEVIGMASHATDIDYNISAVPDNLIIKTVKSQQDFHDYGLVMSSVSTQLNEDIAVRFYQTIGEHYQKSPKADMFIAYLKNTPVAISSCIEAHGIGGIYDIVTNPLFQKRGIGTIMTKTAAQSLKNKGCSIIGMQATAQGERIYSKLGFAKYRAFKCYSNEYMLKESLV
ncbi:GNAT family N-acetyltransferase [Candidatus Sarmatiella mevalonica]|uniref:GNAT family N-acetyltransferase n=1 Tax=Candidatus Sarmatiella mevalonica TaxID=2770581 RepID=UPI001924C278|nr:GNAT family N-acetyltransferase [Candidatus Sarmatiella mevalonica]